MVYKLVRTVVFIKVVRYICIETFVNKRVLLFELYGYMYCYFYVLPEAILYFPINNIVYIIFLQGT